MARAPPWLQRLTLDRGIRDVVLPSRRLYSRSRALGRVPPSGLRCVRPMAAPSRLAGRVRAEDGRDRAELLRSQHRTARAAAAGARRDRAGARVAAVCRGGAGDRQRLSRRLSGGCARARRRRGGDRTRAPARQGRERQRAAPPRAGTLRAAAQRGLRAVSGREPRALAGARGAAAIRVRGGAAGASGRRRAGLGLALSLAALRAGRGAAAAQVADRAEPRATHARGRLVPVGRPARAPRGRRGGRLPGPRLLRLFRRGRLRAAPARRGLAQRLRAAGARGPPRAALHGHGSRATDSRTGTRARPLHAQASQRRRSARGALADGLELRAAGARSARPPAPLGAALLAPRGGYATTVARRGTARGGRALRPRRLKPSSSSRAVTTSGSSCEPAARSSSARACAGALAARYGRSVTIAS